MNSQRTVAVLVAELIVLFVFAILAFGFTNKALAWEVDLSRRRKDVVQSNRQPDGKPSEVESFDDMVNKVAGTYDRQEFVILNTAHGFVPTSIRVKKGNHYTVHIVNVNEEKKNVSFMLDAFAQNHGTYYGKIKSFQLDPNKDGIFTFNCPETAAEGRLIVFSSGGAAPVNRGLSSESK